jgi:hypothetical protein
LDDEAAEDLAQAAGSPVRENDYSRCVREVSCSLRESDPPSRDNGIAVLPRLRCSRRARTTVRFSARCDGLRG